MSIQGEVTNGKFDLTEDSGSLMGAFAPVDTAGIRMPHGAEPTVSAQAEAKIDYSFVIPVKDEEVTLSELCGRIREQFGPEIQRRDHFRRRRQYRSVLDRDQAPERGESRRGAWLAVPP